MRPRHVLLLTALLAALYALWFFTTHEKVARTEYTGYRGEARINHFLAAEMLLSEVGVEADSVSSLTPSDWLPETTDTLVTSLSTTISVGSERALMLDWVENGGHLILLPPEQQDTRASEDFLDRLGFSFYTPEAGNDETVEGATENGGDNDEAGVYALALERVAHRINVENDDGLGATLTDSLGIVAARREVGIGYVTVIAGCCFFNNSSIAEADHARFLLDVTSGYIDPGKVWLVYDAAFASFWEQVWAHAPYAVLSISALAAIWIWAVMPRFGPLVMPDSLARRSITEHVLASGNFVWRNAGSGPLLRSVSAAIIHEAESRHPGIGRLSPEARAQRVARITGLPVQDVWNALEDDADVKHREFTQNVQVLQKLRNEL